MAPTGDAREMIVHIAHQLFAMGQLTATGGNLSARAADGETIWITPTRMFKGELQPGDLVRIDARGTVVEGERAPSIEFPMHWAAYRARPEAAAVVHTHPPYATAFAICGQALPPVNTDAVLLAGTPTVPWLMPGSAALAEAVGAALRQNRGAFLQNHGLITTGATMRAAATHAMMLEETAKLVLLCRQLGGPAALIPESGIRELARFRDFI